MSQPTRSMRGRRADTTVEISAVLIAKDEAAHIADLASSLEGAVDEVVLLDTGSSDETVALAKRHGFRVFHRAWTDHFGDARNAALAHARGQWVLSIDADERLVAQDRNELRRLFAALAQLTDGDQADGFFVTLDNYLTDDLDARATERFQQVRLFRRSRFHYEGRIHEQLRVGALQRPPLFLRAPGTIRIAHLGYTPEIARRKDKPTRNRLLVEAAMAEQADDRKEPGMAAQLRFERARVEMSTSPVVGVELMLSALDELPRDSDLHRHGTATAARFLVEAGRHDDALAVLERAQATDEYSTTFGVIRATALARSGRDLEATDVLAQVERSTNRHSSEVDTLVRLPALKAELLTLAGGPRESWRMLVTLMAHPVADLAGTANGIATRSWRTAARAGCADSYLAPLSEVTEDDEFRRVLPLLPEQHERAAAGTRHVLKHGPMTEPDPRLTVFLPRLAGHSIAACLELGRSRLDTEPALALGVAQDIARRADATSADADAAGLLELRALLLLNHVEQAASLAGTLATEVGHTAADEALLTALRAMAKEFAASYADA